MSQTAQALWITQAGRAALQTEPVAGEVQVKTLFSGISRGTERLVFQGRVPESEHDTMRAPFQAGSFAFPIKYGYSAVGEIKGGDRDGEVIFALFPHQDHFALPAHMATPVPKGVPAKRAILAANMETALNIIWDAGIAPGDRVAVIGSGVVGALSGYLAAQIPGTEVELIDIDPGKAALAKALNCAFALPDAAQGDVDVAIHASASSAGLSTAIHLAGMEATIVEASWYGDALTEVPLGGPFHQKRLRIVGSQVGCIPPLRAARWDYARRLSKALSLLADPVLDNLISGETEFGDLPNAYAGILEDPATLCHRVRYA